MVDVGGIFVELTVIFLIITLVSALMKLLRQPLIIGYILSGVLVSPQVFGIITGREDFVFTLASFGVAFLLFLVGLHLNPEKIDEFGAVSLIAGLSQILLSFGFGFGISSLLGFDMIASLYVGIALSFSSTVVIMKLLSDAGETETLHGRVSIGILLIQDFVVMLMFFVLPALQSDRGVSFIFVESLGILTLILVGLFLISKYLVPKALSFISRSQEFLLITGATWCLLVASLFSYFGLSFEIGALLAGVGLSVSPYRHEISSKMRILRDFFLILFFIQLGSEIALDMVGQVIIPVLIVTAFVLLGKPIIIMSIMGILGYGKRTSFYAGVTLAQISEFSLILVSIGVNKMGHVGPEILSFVTLVGLLSIAGSSYFIAFKSPLYRALKPYLGVFERENVVKDEEHEAENYKLLLFGHNRTGYDLVNDLIEDEAEVFVVDYDPDVIDSLEERGIPAKFGDAGDVEFLNELDFTKPKHVVSTIPTFEVNELILKTVKKENPAAVVVVVAYDVEEALELYDHGADYVLVPHLLGGSHAAELLNDIEEDREGLRQLRKEHIIELENKKDKLIGKTRLRSDI